MRVLSALLVVSLPALALAAERSADLKSEAQRCANAMLASDPTDAIGCMNPRLVAALGGVDSAKRTLARKLREMDERGAKFEGVAIGEPEKPVVLNGREFALVPETLRIRIKDGVLRQKAHMLAVRDEDSQQWSFFDAAPALPKALATLYPDTPAAEFDKLVIPEREAPVLEN